MDRNALKKIFNEFQIDKNTLVKVKRLFDGMIDPIVVSEQAAAWALRCYNHPSHQECVMHALNELLGCHGVECCEEHGFQYLNSGDIYSPSIIFEDAGTRAYVGSYADYIDHLQVGKDIEYLPVACELNKLLDTTRLEL